MIKVKKNLSNIPKVLQKENRKIAFNNNVILKKYQDDKNLYKSKTIRKRLIKIYNSKCGYCEKSLLDSPKHIEHYRPKNGGYYWLSYSWDNLLFSCGECNSSKSNNFTINNSRVSYLNENFDQIHNLSNNYDILEEPLIINPEKDDILNQLYYDKKGCVFSENVRISHTINIACNLNRDELIEKRERIINNFFNLIEGHILCFSKDNTYKTVDYGELKKNIKTFINIIKNFMNDTNIKSEFYSLRYFLQENIEFFFDDKTTQNVIRHTINLTKKDYNERTTSS
ncbi:HNH endonuclease [Poseidonibacter lekithochrous]|uniref:HNH endonuclease n=1 Tax=Poseidonibacter lekithochrous TaxID=1904463 RepID=UPI000D383C10|nr:HNH endonuclease [Poseidonibacter lekithochrous]